MASRTSFATSEVTSSIPATTIAGPSQKDIDLVRCAQSRPLAQTRIKARCNRGIRTQWNDSQVDKVGTREYSLRLVCSTFCVTSCTDMESGAGGTTVRRRRGEDQKTNKKGG